MSSSGTIAIGCLVVTIAVRAEVAVLFVASGLVDILYYGSLFRGRFAASSATVVTAGTGATKAGSASLHCCCSF